MSALRVVVTGAAGQIAYSLLYSIARGDVFGKDQPIVLLMLDIAPMIEVVKGVVMELQDCSLPLLKECVATSDVQEAFTDVDACIMVGAMPRREGMERKDLLKANVKIFEQQGQALNTYAKKTVKVLVVGNPANTNCYTLMKNAKSIPTSNFTCLTRLDQNRAQAQIAMRVGSSCDAVVNTIIWGNHSTTQFPDVTHAKVNNVAVYDAVKDDAWLKGDFITTVQKRGGAVIKARKLSSAMSAAKAIGDHMRDWWFGTKPDQWVSMGVLSTGNKYGIAEDLIFSFPVRINADREWEIVDGLPISDFAREKLDITTAELQEERDVAKEFLSA